MNDPRIGAQLYSVRGHTDTADDVAETFAKVRAAGYSGVQVSAFGPVDAADVARLAKEHGLEIGATHFGWDEFRSDLDRLIDIHQRWGCRHAAIGGLPEDYREAGGVERFAAELGRSPSGWPRPGSTSPTTTTTMSWSVPVAAPGLPSCTTGFRGRR